MNKPDFVPEGAATGGVLIDLLMSRLDQAASTSDLQGKPNVTFVDHAIAPKRCTAFCTDCELREFLALRQYGFLSLKSLCQLTRYSSTQVSRTARELKRRGLIQELGSIFGLQILAPGPERVSPLPEWCRGPGRKFAKPGQPFFGPFYESTTKVKVNKHAFEVGRASAWICEEFHRAGMACLVYPESILRGDFGWSSSPLEDGSHKYLTQMPDVWVVTKTASFRVQLQLTPKSVPTYEKVIDDDTSREPLLYVGADTSILKSLYKLQVEKSGKFGVARLGDEKDLAIWLRFMRAWRGLEGEIVNPQRDRCAHLNFRRYLQNPAVHSEHDDWSRL